MLREELAELKSRMAAQALVDPNTELFPALVQQMSEGLIIQNADGVLVYVNQALCARSGYTREEMLGQPPEQFFDPVDIEHYHAQMEARRQGGTARYELTCRAKNGELIHALVSPSALYDETGAYCGAFAVLTDLTERKRMEADLDRERARLRALMDHLPDSVYVKDDAGRFVLANRAKLARLGIPRMVDLAGKTALEVFPEGTGQQFHEADLGVIQSGEPLINAEQEVTLPSGNTVWELSSKAPLRNKRGEVTGMVGISRDITRHRESELARRRSEQRFREILEHSRDIAYKFDVSASLFEYISPSAVQLLGYSHEMLMNMGGAVRELIHPEDVSRFERFIEQLHMYADKRQAAPACEYRLRHAAGGYRWFSDNASLLANDAGDYVARIGTLRDITETKRAQDALRESSRLEVASTLAGGIAHDFNNLMAAVLGNAEVLSLELAGDEHAVDMLRDITQAAEKGGHLAQQLLAFARGGKYQPRALLLNEVISETLRLENHPVPAHISVELDLAADLWQVRADASQMSQVVTNLVSNAIEAMPDGGTLRIETRNREVTGPFDAADSAAPAPGRYAEVRMSDTGHGMAAPVLERVFEPFFSTRFQGRGLGLSAVYGIITNHDGRVYVESQSNRGATFSILLPAYETASEAAAPPEDGLPVGHETILLVDDEPLLLTSTRMILERLGYETLTAVNGQEAVDLVRAQGGAIDLVLLDLAMPVMDGAEAFGHIRHMHPEIEVILCSGYDLDPSAQRLLDEGARSFIKKPFRMQGLARELRRTLDARDGGKSGKKRQRKKPGRKKK